jgi:hypothetical protein
MPHQSVKNVNENKEAKKATAANAAPSLPSGERAARLIDKATDIRLRAERRAGEMLAENAKAVGGGARRQAEDRR